MPLNSNGYVYEKVHGHPLADNKGRVLQHRRIWFDTNGAIPKGFVIHHINGNKADNRLENLELCDRSSHMKSHYPNGFCSDPWNKGKTEYIEKQCGNCGKLFMKLAKEVRKAEKRGHKNHICNAKCLVQFMRKHRAREEKND